MTKNVILITGTSCVGKTTVARILAKRLDALNINITQLAKKEKLIRGKDRERDTFIIDPREMRRVLSRTIQRAGQQSVIVDGHYAATVTPRKLVTHVFVLRRSPIELRRLMRKKRYVEPKIAENLAAEILDVPLFDALKTQQKEKVCEVDLTGKRVKQNVSTILNIIEGIGQCTYGGIDWIGKLEDQGVLDKYLTI